MICIDKKYIKQGQPPSKEVLRRCFELFSQQRPRLDKLYAYLDGEHDIKSRKMKSKYAVNNKIVCNHAEYITDMAVGYVHGSPVQYSGKEGSADELNKLFTDIDEDSHNAELGADISTFGYGLEYVYMSDDAVPEPRLAVIDPRCGFLVCNTNINHAPLFGVLFGPRIGLQGATTGYDVTVSTAAALYFLYSPGTGLDSFSLEKEMTNPFGAVNLIEYKNNKRSKGDFEGVLSLIDAYNLLQSDRLNDKQQLVDALLVISGMSLGDTEDEVGETAKLIHDERIIELAEGGSAEWLVKQLNETEVEVLKKSIKDDIHEFSKVPCLTDENFANNASGVAMKYKLLGFEQLGKTKERYFKQGLRKRLGLIANVNAIKGKHLDVSKIDIVMKRSLPVDEEMLARIAQATEGLISWETRLLRYDAELDPDTERKRLQKEKKESAEMQRLAFGGIDNTPPEGEEDEE